MKKTVLAVAAAAAFAPLAAHATDGYFAHGWGMKAKGRGGASTAMTTDAFGGATNPATMAFAGDRLDIGLDWFRPDRSAKREGSFGGAGFLDGSAEGNETENFLIPEFGYNKMLRPDLSLGISVYGNGGMNTDYPTGQLDQGVCQGGFPNGVPANLLCGGGNLGVDLAQLTFAPTIAWKFNPNHSVGISPLIAYQRFKAYGLQPFAAISSDPANLTNKGYDDAWGFGARVGYYGQLTPSFAVGVGYSTKIDMSEFDKYKGLFAEQGDFDIPENFSVGVAFKATPKLTIAADYQRIYYNKVKSVGNPSNQPNCTPTPPFGPGVGPDCLGASGSSIGFGWQNVDAFKIGIEYQWSNALVLRAGYNKSDNPITPRDVTFNILAPGVIEEHMTLGFTYSWSKTGEITMAYMHAFENSVSGPANNPYFPVGGTETISLSEDSLGIAFGWKF
ncbi:MAG TPA: outer membrane protein transport protein [Burkholderiales bacterium]|nr:outer membrane protein transport protein [Burkholderiales bacterium]